MLRSRIRCGPRARHAACVLLASASALMVVPNGADALTITPTFNANLSAGAISSINNAIAFYQNTFSDPINVDNEYHNLVSASTVGQAEFFLYSIRYDAYSPALVLDRTSADDNSAAVAIQANNPVSGTSQIFLTSANARATNIIIAPATFSTASGHSCTGTFDGCIGLNLTIANDPPSPYSLFAVILHEINHVLGLASALDPGSTPTNVYTTDLFRWAAAGTRSHARNANCATAPAAYFSVDGGVTNLSNYNNCDNNADYVGWAQGGTPQVGDAFASIGATPTLNTMSPEVRALDVIGYTLSAQTAVPEPTAFVLAAVGLAGIGLAARRRGGRARSV